MKTSVRWLAGLAFSGVVGMTLAQPVPDALKHYEQRCAVCHGDDASGSDRGPALSRSRSLRTRSLSEIHDIVQKGTANGMPPFPLPEDQLHVLAGFIRSMNASALDAPPSGDTAAGERFFFGRGQCASCHTALGRGKSVGPDLSNTGRQFTLAELTRKVKSTNAQISAGYATVTARLRDGRTIRGFARKETLHSIQLQTLDGRLLALADGEYEITARDKTSAMPPLTATAEEERDLLAFLSRLGGLPVGALADPVEHVSRAAVDQILLPKLGEWPTYNGNLNGNRHSLLEQINQRKRTGICIARMKEEGPAMSDKKQSRRQFLKASTGLTAAAAAALADPPHVAAQSAGVKKGDLPDLTIKEVKVHVADLSSFRRLNSSETGAILSVVTNSGHEGNYTIGNRGLTPNWLELNRTLDLPLHVGEFLTSISGFAEYIRRGALDVARLIADNVGGISGSMRVGALADAFNLKCTPHNWGNPTDLAVHFHLELAMPNANWFEMPHPATAVDRPYQAQFRIDKEGYVLAPSEPGMGYPIDRNALDKLMKRIDR